MATVGTVGTVGNMSSMREETQALAREYDKLINEFLEDVFIIHNYADKLLLLPIHDSRFRTMFVGRLRGLANDAHKWRNATRALNEFIEASR